MEEQESNDNSLGNVHISFTDGLKINQKDGLFNNHGPYINCDPIN